MRSSRPRSNFHRPAPRTCLRRGEEARRDDDRVAAQVRLVLKLAPELGPPAVHDGLRQPPVPGHVPHGQVLDHDRVEAAGQHVAGLVEHRLPLVRHPQVKARNLLPGDPATVAALSPSWTGCAEGALSRRSDAFNFRFGGKVKVLRRTRTGRRSPSARDPRRRRLALRVPERVS